MGELTLSLFSVFVGFVLSLLAMFLFEIYKDNRLKEKLILALRNELKENIDLMNNNIEILKKSIENNKLNGTINYLPIKSYNNDILFEFKKLFLKNYLDDYDLTIIYYKLDELKRHIYFFNTERLNPDIKESKVNYEKICTNIINLSDVVKEFIEDYLIKNKEVDKMSELSNIKEVPKELTAPFKITAIAFILLFSLKIITMPLWGYFLLFGLIAILDLFHNDYLRPKLNQLALKK